MRKASAFVSSLIVSLFCSIIAFADDVGPGMGDFITDDPSSGNIVSICIVCAVVVAVTAVAVIILIKRKRKKADNKNGDDR